MGGPYKGTPVTLHSRGKKDGLHLRNVAGGKARVTNEEGEDIGESDKPGQCACRKKKKKGAEKNQYLVWGLQCMGRKLRSKNSWEKGGRAGWLSPEIQPKFFYGTGGTGQKKKKHFVDGVNVKKKKWQRERRRKEGEEGGAGRESSLKKKNTGSVRQTCGKKKRKNDKTRRKTSQGEKGGRGRVVERTGENWGVFLVGGEGPRGGWFWAQGNDGGDEKGREHGGAPHKKVERSRGRGGGP